MNLIIRMLIVWIVLDFEIKLIFGAYKKRKDEHCSLQVNSMCYDDELQNDKPLKIVHDETGMKIVADEEVTKKKRPKKVSTDVLQPKVSRQLSWDLPKLFSKLNLLNSHNAQQTAQQQSTTIHSPPLTRSQLDSSKLIVKFHKLNNSRTNRPLTKFKQSNVPATVIPNTVVYNQLTSLRSPIVNSNIATNHLNKFKAINRPLLASGSFHNAAYLTKGFNKFNSYPLISPFVNTLTLSLPDHYSDSLLLTEESPNYTAYDFRRPTRRPTKIASNYLPKSISNKKIPKNLSFDSLRTTTTVAPTASTNYWMPSYFTTSDALITEPLPTNLTNYINLRESGKLGSYLANQTSESHNNYNTTQDRVWTEDEPNDIFPTKSSASSKFDFSFDSRKSINKTDDKMFDKLQFESSNSLETDLTTPNSDHPFSSTEESSKEEIDAFKLSNQLANHPNEFERAKDHNQDRFFRFTKPDGFIKPEQNVKQDDSREFGLNEKFESAQPLNQHEWPTVDHHHLDELLATGGKEKTNHEKSQINYLVDGDDEQKENLLMNQNYPIFYPAKAATNGNRKPTYTIVQSKDKNVDKWKRYIKLMKRIAVEEAKKFKKNELDTFLKRKKLIVDRYKPNDMYQKAIGKLFVLHTYDQSIAINLLLLLSKSGQVRLEEGIVGFLEFAWLSDRELFGSVAFEALDSTFERVG